MANSTRASEATQDEWRALYSAAIAFRDLAPWQWMWDSEMFGVQDPASGEIGYCCVLGRLREQFALVVYDGSAGLDGAWKMRAQGPNPDYMDVLVLQKCLMASFEDRNMLDRYDLEQIKTLGLKVRGRGAWPQFRDYLPGYSPWYLTAPQVRFLTAVLRQAVDVTERFRTDRRLLPTSRPGGNYLVRVPLTDRADGPWKDTIRRPEPLPETRPPAAPKLDTVVRERLRRLPTTNGRLEMDCFYMPNPIGPDDVRPYFAKVILAADRDSGMVLAAEAVHPADLASGLLNTFVSVVEGLKMLPERILVQDPEILAVLKAPAASIGVRVVKARRMIVIPVARQELTAYLGR